MARLKIDYGIDLGTTNSAIARADNGEIRVFPIEPFKKTTMPSCVQFTKRKDIHVGDMAYNRLRNPTENNTFTEFKRTMGSDDLYISGHMGKSYSSEELSAEVLIKLKASVKDEQSISAAVITVPADFEQVQIEATRRAAEKAGFEYFELLQEPIAASLAYLHDQKNVEGTWLVFDLGGGTFDAALVRMEDGIMTVVDHAGDNHLGGKNMDLLIIDEIVIPYLEQNYEIEKILEDDTQLNDLRKRWKYDVEVGKIELTERDSVVITPYDIVCKDDDGVDILPDVNVTREEYEVLITPLVDRAITICKELLEKNNLSSSDLTTVLMIGGPTYTPFIRRKVKEEFFQDINVTIDPMTAVAIGAAVFASTKAIPLERQERDYSKIQLTLAYPDTTAESEVSLGIRIEQDKLEGKVPPKIMAEVSRNDKGWMSGQIELESGVALVSLHLAGNSTNAFSIQLYDGKGNALESEPNSISILQGVKIAPPPMPHDIGVSAIHLASGNEEKMVPIIQKGSALPAVGNKIFKAPKNLRPGNSEDELNVIVREGEGGTRSSRNVWVGQVKISGDKLQSLLPEGSDVEVTIRIDESRRATVSVYLPYLDETIDGAMDTNYKHSAPPSEELAKQIESEHARLADLQEKSYEIDVFAENLDTIELGLGEITELNEKGRGDNDRQMEVERRLSELAVKIDEVEENIKWPELEKRLEEELGIVEQVVDRFGSSRKENVLSKLRAEAKRAIDLKSAKRVIDVIDKFTQLRFSILREQQPYWVSVFMNINECFDEIPWVDTHQARTLISEGSSYLENQQLDEIESLVIKLWDLMPDEEIEKTKAPRTDILHY